MSAPFGHTRRPLFTCRLTVVGERASYVVQVLGNGCFVAERRRRGRAVYGCGAGAPAARANAQPLPGDAVGRAALAALAQAPVVYRGTGLAVSVGSSTLARLDDPGRGGYARVKCGRRAQDRTVVVSLEFPAMRPSASLSQGVVLVSASPAPTASGRCFTERRHRAPRARRPRGPRCPRCRR